MQELTLKPLTVRDLSEIVKLTKFLNPEMSSELLLQRQTDMFSFQNHVCLGCYNGKDLVGLSSGWLTVRLYSGRQLEIDNVIIRPELQSKGIGARFLELLEGWARKNECLTLELNAYVENERAHKFYGVYGYKKLGFHFQKSLTERKGETMNGCFTGG